MPKEELSLDVIKQYTVVRATILCASSCSIGLQIASHILTRSAAADRARSAALMHKASDYTCMFCVQRCPTRDDKTVVLKDMIFPLCEKLGQTIIFVRTRDTARRLHQHVRHLRQPTEYV